MSQMMQDYGTQGQGNWLTDMVHHLSSGFSKALDPGATDFKKQGRPNMNLGTDAGPTAQSESSPQFRQQNYELGWSRPGSKSASTYGDMMNSGAYQAGMGNYGGGIGADDSSVGGQIAKNIQNRQFRNNANSYASQMNNAGYSVSPSDYNNSPSWSNNAPLGAGASDEDIAIQSGDNPTHASAMTDAASSTGAGGGGTNYGAIAGSIISSLMKSYSNSLSNNNYNVSNIDYGAPQRTYFQPIQLNSWGRQ